jgi:Ca2+-binding RTX toxin-like protein
MVTIDFTGNEFANQIWGNGAGNSLNGGGGNDALFGFDGNDTLNGGTGSDALFGGSGADTFAFTTALGATNVDLIADFVSGTDKIALDDAMFTGLSLGALSASAFVNGTSAQDADDRILYDAASGNLFFDADGNGAGTAVLFATLQGHPPIAASDFIVI